MFCLKIKLGPEKTSIFRSNPLHISSEAPPSLCDTNNVYPTSDLCCLLTIPSALPPPCLRHHHLWSMI
ncbi:hypothetical protein Pfo_003913 [Paulownia fortunei]|nr:hypothetical protein Pfo_003913 [Paulownia fortunei]